MPLMRLSRVTAVGAAALAVFLAVAPATAGNWTLGGTISERLDARRSLESDGGDGAPFRSSTRLGMALGYENLRTLWALSSGASYVQPIGSGEDGNLDGITNPRASGSVVYRAAGDQTIGANLSVARRSLDFVNSPFFLDGDFIDGDPVVDDEPLDIDLIELDEEATETRIGFGANWSWTATPRTSFSLGTSGSVRRFSEESPDLVPSRSIGLSGSVNRVLDPRTSAGLSLSYRNFSSDGQLSDVSTDALTLSTNLSRQLTPRHSFGASIGAGATRTEETTLLAASDEEDLALNFQGGLNFAYLGSRGTSFALSASRSLETTAEGRLENVTRVTGSANYRRPLTRLTSFRLNGALSLSLDSNEVDSQFGQGVRVATGLDRRLSQHWSAATGIDLRYARDEEDDNLSAGVFLQISRAFTLNR